VSDFSKCRSRKDGLQRRCKECCKAYRDANKEALKKYFAGYYQENRERVLEKQKSYYANNKEERLAYGAEWRGRNQERIKASNAEYYINNREKSLSYCSEWAAKNRDRKKAHAQRRRAIKANAQGEFSAEDWRQKLAYYGYKCRFCGIHKNDTPEGWLEADHAIPLSRGGTNWISNIVPACKSCNCSKGTRTFKEFMGYINGN
jgi:5-methylcytosine-specific restriction endonuclease McrA